MHLGVTTSLCTGRGSFPIAALVESTGLRLTARAWRTKSGFWFPQPLHAILGFTPALAKYAGLLVGNKNLAAMPEDARSLKIQSLACLPASREPCAAPMQHHCQCCVMQQAAHSSQACVVCCPCTRHMYCQNGTWTQTGHMQSIRCRLCPRCTDAECSWRALKHGWGCMQHS